MSGWQRIGIVLSAIVVGAMTLAAHADPVDGGNTYCQTFTSEVRYDAPNTPAASLYLSWINGFLEGRASGKSLYAHKPDEKLKWLWAWCAEHPDKYLYLAVLDYEDKLPDIQQVLGMPK